MIRLGIIGLGTMGKHILAGALAHAEFEVLSIFDTRIQHLSAPHLSGEQYQAIQFADSLDEMLSRDDIDLIYIGTPPDSHIQYCHLCLDKGKAIWCEKPLATDIIQAEQLVSRISEMKVKAAVNLSLATSPLAIALEEHVSQLNIQSLQKVEIQLAFNRWPRAWQQGASQWLDSPQQGGFLREVFSHFVFIHHRMFGPLTLLSSDVSFHHPLKSETYVKANYLSEASKSLPTSVIGRVDPALEDLVQWTLYFDQQLSQRPQSALRFLNWHSLLSRDDDGKWQEIPVTNLGSVLTQLDEITKMMQDEPHRLASFAEALAVQHVVEATLGASSVDTAR